MAATRLALALAIVAAACTPVAETPPVTSAPVTTTAPPPTTSTEPVATTTSPVALVLDPVEALAADRGIRLRVTDETGRELGWLDRKHPELTVDAATERVTITYVTAEGTTTDVTWEQIVDGAITRVGQPWRGRRECVANLPDGSTAEVSLVWQAAGTSAEYLSQLEDARGEVTVVSPIWWRMRSDGTVASSTDASYVAAVHDRNVAIWPAIAGFDADAHHLAFATPEKRTALASEVSEEARRIGADGVNIDIEGYRAEDADEFLAWVVELAELVRSWGGVVSYDIVPRSDTWEVGPEDLAFWSTAPPRPELAWANDCMVLMAYDQHNRYRPAGPVAAPAWVEDLLVYELRHADPAQLVLGMPFYGRIWDPDELDSPRAVSISALARLVDDGEVSFDATFGLDRVELGDGRFFWAETPAGLGHRLDLVEEYGLAGWAAWRFGFDGPDVWDVIGGG